MKSRCYISLEASAFGSGSRKKGKDVQRTLSNGYIVRWTVVREVEGSSPEPPKIISRSPQIVYVVKGMKLVLECYAVGYPLPQVTWMRDNKLLKNKTSTYANFERQTATMEDNGSYTCRAENSLGYDNHTVQVIVIEPPKIISKSLLTVYVVKDMKLVLECYAVGYPLPQVTWTRDNKLLKNETSTYANFERQTATMEDNGSYTCRAKNSLGYDNHTVRVIVIGKEDVESPIDCNKLLIVVIVLIVLLFGVLVIAFAVIFCLVQKNKKLDLLSKNSSDEQKDEDGSLELLPNPVVRKDLSQPVDSYLKSDVSLPVYLDATEL
ncbi:Tyrosine-protein kinase-like otk [Stylophora pistillata]|uniref:Tyrosine-protein kinase-like otk n=1 Tax=Stylophora pistillata TaxID=50429 RepID=A0A2B4SHY8_STYPI|nr:Tyrosine-protein kinase-like otk [Stylophora pistillata]